MNDIEAAAFARYWGKPSPHDASLRAVAEAAWMARSALAHAARGEGECEDCDAGHHAFRIDRDAGGRVFHDLPNGQIIQCQKTSRAYASPTPPPSTGDASNPGEKEER